MSTDFPPVIHTPRGSLSLGPQPSEDSYPQDSAPLLLQENLEPKPTTSPQAADIHRGQVSDRWPYLLEKLARIDDSWERVSIGALVKIGRETSPEAVSYALSIAELTRPDVRSTAYGWLRATAKTFAEIGV